MKEQMYQDFTTKLLPTLQQGLTITKDYFIDLFGRYVKYLIISDSILLFFGVILLIVGIIISTIGLKKWKLEKEWAERNSWNEKNPVLLIIGGISLFFSIVLIIGCTNNIVKDIYIPEVRIYEIVNCKTCNR